VASGVSPSPARPQNNRNITQIPKAFNVLDQPGAHIPGMVACKNAPDLVWSFTRQSNQGDCGVTA
jgi:hypothetical protein